MSIPFGPQTAIGEYTHSTKYREDGEDFREANNRMCAPLADNDEHYHALREVTGNQRFLFGGRIQRASGSSSNVTHLNCYVSGTIQDSYVDDVYEQYDSIMGRTLQAAATMRMGGGIGFDYSPLRPRGDLIVKLGSQSSGPLSFANIKNAVGLCTASSGHRRGAMMLCLRVDHPDIESFIYAKRSDRDIPGLWRLVNSMDDDHPEKGRLIQELQQFNKLTGFNISVLVTDEFMEAVINDRPFDLKFNGRVYRTVQARKLFEKIMRSTWDWAEPGVIFVDQINRMNNLWYCETISATNPCGEQPLPPYGACLLGSSNLVKYAHPELMAFDFDQMERDLYIAVRALDNVTDRSIYPLSEQEAEALSKRRMGIGVTGLANALEPLYGEYGSRSFIGGTEAVLEKLRDTVYNASIDLAIEKGPFPAFDRDKYMESKFIKTLPIEIQNRIAKHGIRNSHLLSIAPTGTISLAADNVSSAIEPVFGYSSSRIIQEFDGPRSVEVDDYGVRFFDYYGKLADDCTIDDHLGVLLTAQRYMDAAVSKTCNVNPEMPWEEFKSVYVRAWEGGAKGVTTFNPGGQRLGILKKVEKKTEGACFIDPATGERSCDE